jgi:hypothetical protein
MTTEGKLVGALVVEPEATLPREIVRLKMFDKVADEIFTPDEITNLEYSVASSRHLGRDLGVPIKGTGGVRELRWQIGNKRGKSGGARIWYYCGGDHMPIFLLGVSRARRKT